MSGMISLDYDMSGPTTVDLATEKLRAAGIVAGAGPKKAGQAGALGVRVWTEEQAALAHEIILSVDADARRI